MNVDISLSHSRPFVSGDFDDHHCNESISTAGHLSDASHAPAPVHSTSSMPYSHYPGSTRNCVEDDYGSSAWHEPPNCSSVVAEVLQDDVVQNAFLDSNYRDVQNTPTRFLEQSGSCLVDGMYPSAGQQIIHRDLRLSREGEQYPFPYDKRNGNDGPSRESSIGPIVSLPPHFTSSTHPSPSYASTASTRHKDTLAWPQEPPSDCPWGGFYDADGKIRKCSYDPANALPCKVLRHWAWRHVANDVFAFQTGILTCLEEAKIVNTPEKLECAILYLGLCPNEECQESVPCTATACRPAMVKTHLERRPECKSFFTDPPVQGYRELGKQLGYICQAKRASLKCLS
ncbi:hypothetical protein BU17DRAFT_72652 [Hysterangium stoloniferum]|nr:hypothetical protein BU17DRAFT_72652 [Hysterangium stoloniferum]